MYKTIPAKPTVGILARLWDSRFLILAAFCVVNENALLRRMNEVGTGRARNDLQRLLRDLGDTTPPGVGTPGIIRRPGKPPVLD